MCRTRWISRIDGLDIFEERFTYFGTLEYSSINPESTINRDTRTKVQALLTHISNFNFIVFVVMTRKVFDFTHSVTALLQAKLNDIINGFQLNGSLIDLMSNIRINIEKYHDESYSEACKLAQKINLMNLCQEPVLGKLQGKISLLNHHLIITNYPYQFH